MSFLAVTRWSRHRPVHQVPRKAFTDQVARCLCIRIEALCPSRRLGVGYGFFDQLPALLIEAHCRTGRAIRTLVDFQDVFIAAMNSAFCFSGITHCFFLSDSEAARSRIDDSRELVSTLSLTHRRFKRTSFSARRTHRPNSRTRTPQRAEVVPTEGTKEHWPRRLCVGEKNAGAVKKCDTASEKNHSPGGEFTSGIGSWIGQPARTATGGYRNSAGVQPPERLAAELLKGDQQFFATPEAGHGDGRIALGHSERLGRLCRPSPM